MNRIAYYLWCLIPLRYIFTPVATWLLPYAGAYAFRDDDRIYLADEIRHKWWTNAKEITKKEPK